MTTVAVDTPKRILDAALRLFTTTGVGATSIRAIIREAGVNLNAIHYHFGSKEAVIGAIFRRVMAPINAERQALLDSAEAAQNVRLTELVHAMYWPLFRRSVAPQNEIESNPGASDGGRAALLLAAQLRHDPSQEARIIMGTHQAVYAPKFEALLQRVTGQPEPELRLAIRFLNAAAWGVVTQPLFIDDVLADPSRDGLIETLFDDFLNFVVPGFDATVAAAQRDS